MRKRSILLVGGVLALLASLVVGPAATAGPERASAGTVVIIHDQEPPTLRGAWEDNNLLATSLVAQNILQGGMIYNNKAHLIEKLLDDEQKMVMK
jgi:hypothetical protein